MLLPGAKPSPYYRELWILVLRNTEIVLSLEPQPDSGATKHRNRALARATARFRCYETPKSCSRSSHSPIPVLRNTEIVLSLEPQPDSGATKHRNRALARATARFWGMRAPCWYHFGSGLGELPGAETDPERAPKVRLPRPPKPPRPLRIF
jgi:hypothetical protein